MFLKQERHGIDDFKRKKTLVVKDKYFAIAIFKKKQVLTDTLNIFFAYSFVSEHYIAILAEFLVL